MTIFSQKMRLMKSLKKYQWAHLKIIAMMEIRINKINQGKINKTIKRIHIVEVFVEKLVLKIKEK